MGEGQSGEEEGGVVVCRQPSFVPNSVQDAAPDRVEISQRHLRDHLVEEANRTTIRKRLVLASQ
jgi:hypothetical protein